MAAVADDLSLSDVAKRTIHDHVNAVRAAQLDEFLSDRNPRPVAREGVRARASSAGLPAFVARRSKGSRAEPDAAACEASRSSTSARAGRTLDLYLCGDDVLMLAACRVSDRSRSRYANASGVIVCTANPTEIPTADLAQLCVVESANREDFNATATRCVVTSDLQDAECRQRRNPARLILAVEPERDFALLAREVHETLLSIAREQLRDQPVALLRRQEKLIAAGRAAHIESIHAERLGPVPIPALVIIRSRL